MICLCVYHFMYSSSHVFHSKVHFNIDARKDGSFRPRLLSIKSTSSSQCFTSAYHTWSCLVDRTISLPFVTQQITTKNIVFDISCRLPLACMPTHSPKYISGHLLSCILVSLISLLSLAYLVKDISTHCHQIHLTFTKLSNGSQILNVAKQFATAISQCRGPS